MCFYMQPVTNLMQLGLLVFVLICSVQFSSSVVSVCLQHYGLQHARLPYPSPTPGACSSLCPSSWWCHPTISSSLFPFSSCLQSFLTSESFPMSQFFPNWSFNFSISPSSEYSVLISFRMDWFDLVEVQMILKSLLQHCSLKATILWRSALFMVQLSHLYMTPGKKIALTRWTYVGKVVSLHFNMLANLLSEVKRKLLSHVWLFGTLYGL